MSQFFDGDDSSLKLWTSLSCMPIRQTSECWAEIYAGLEDRAIEEAQTCRLCRRQPGQFARLGGKPGGAGFSYAKGVEDRLVLGHGFARMPVRCQAQNNQVKTWIARQTPLRPWQCASGSIPSGTLHSLILKARQQAADPNTLTNKALLISVCVFAQILQGMGMMRGSGSPVLGPLDVERVKDGRPVAVAVGDGSPPGCR